MLVSCLGNILGGSSLLTVDDEATRFFSFYKHQQPPRQSQGPHSVCRKCQGGGVQTKQFQYPTHILNGSRITIHVGPALRGRRDETDKYTVENMLSTKNNNNNNYKSRDHPGGSSQSSVLPGTPGMK